MKNIAIIGGGISGVVSAYYLDKFSTNKSKKINIDIIEKDLEFVKEKIGKFQYGQEIYDKGWHNSIKEQSLLFQFMIELGLHRYLIKSSDYKKVLYTSTGIKYFPEKILYGYPLDKKELLLLDLFNFKEKLSILSNLHKSKRYINLNNLTVKNFFTAYLNDIVYEKITEPLLTDYFGSDISNQSFVALLPELAFATIQNHDLETVVSEMYNKKIADNIITGIEYRLKFTLRSFIETIESKFTDKVFLEFNKKVEKIEKIEKIETRNNKYLLEIDGKKIEYDYVIIATSHNVFLPWFSENENFIRFFDDVQYVSNIVVTFVYKKEDITVNHELGEVIFENNASSYATSVEYCSNKWTDIKTNNIHLVRMYINRQDKVKELLDKTDLEIKELLLKDLKVLHGNLEKESLNYYVTRLQDNYQYCNIEYSRRTHMFSEYMSQNYPNLYIIGSSRKAINFENTILEAKTIAKNILEHIK